MSSQPDDYPRSIPDQLARVRAELEQALATLPAAAAAALVATTAIEIEAALEQLDVVEEAAKNARWFVRRVQDQLMTAERAALGLPAITPTTTR